MASSSQGQPSSPLPYTYTQLVTDLAAKHVVHPALAAQALFCVGYSREKIFEGTKPPKIPSTPLPSALEKAGEWIVSATAEMRSHVNERASLDDWKSILDAIENVPDPKTIPDIKAILESHRLTPSSHSGMKVLGSVAKSTLVYHRLAASALPSDYSLNGLTIQRHGNARKHDDSDCKDDECYTVGLSSFTFKPVDRDDIKIDAFILAHAIMLDVIVLNKLTGVSVRAVTSAEQVDLNRAVVLNSMDIKKKLQNLLADSKLKRPLPKCFFYQGDTRDLFKKGR